MLVYANRLRVQGSEAESAVFKAIGGWLKEQLGFGLRPDQLKQDGEYNGNRGELRSRLRIHGCFDGEPALCAWVLKHADNDVQGRQWIVEVGVKKSAGTLRCEVGRTQHARIKPRQRFAASGYPIHRQQRSFRQGRGLRGRRARRDIENSRPGPGFVPGISRRDRAARPGRRHRPSQRHERGGVSRQPD